MIVHNRSENFAGDIHERNASPFDGVSKITLLWYRDTLALVPSILVMGAIKELGILIFFLKALLYASDGGMPFNPGAFPGLSLLMALSALQNIIGWSISISCSHWGIRSRMLRSTG